MIACSLLLCSIPALLADEDGKSVVETDEDRYSFTSHRDERGMYLLVTPKDEDDEMLGTRFPTDCPECGRGCLMPPAFSFAGNENESGGGVVTLTDENPTRCVRFDGVRRAQDTKILLMVENQGQQDFLIRVLESGKPLLERDVLPGELLEEELIPADDRRYTFWISAGSNHAEEARTDVGFGIYRYEYQDLVMSWIRIGLGVGQ